jgi:hypothetical protein
VDDILLIFKKEAEQYAEDLWKKIMSKQSGQQSIQSNMKLVIDLIAVFLEL